MKHIGICCFTKDIPKNCSREIFPRGWKSVCIEYDKDMLADYFMNDLGMPNCFKEVVYSDDPVKVVNDGDYHLLMRKDENGELYESIMEMKRNPDRFMEKLLFFLFTRINHKFIGQKELRIIWAGFRTIASDDKGYTVHIPKDCIKCVHVYQKTPKWFITAIKKIELDIKKL